MMIKMMCSKEMTLIHQMHIRTERCPIKGNPKVMIVSNPASGKAKEFSSKETPEGSKWKSKKAPK